MGMSLGNLERYARQIRQDLDLIRKATGGGGGVTDHGALTGLADDDHPQYLTPAEGNAAYSALGHGHAQADVTNLVTDLAAKAPTANPTFTGTVTVPDSSFSLAKLANIATARILGRVTAAAGVIEELTGTQATTLLDVFTSALKGLVPASGGGTSNFLRADGAWAAVSATISAPFKGDYACGTFTIETGKFGIMAKRMELTTTQRATIQGTGRLSLHN